MKRMTFIKRKRKILKAINKNQREYEKERKKLLNEKGVGLEIENLNGKYSAEYFMYNDELKEIYTDWYRYRCNKLDLPMHYDNKEYWEELYMPNYKVLTEKGRSVIRENIRNEIYGRQKIAMTWVTLAIGLIGALTGLFAVIGK